MDINAFYTFMGTSSQYPLHRLGSQLLVEKYLNRLLTDPTYGQLRDAIAQGQCQAAFRAAHTLKGIALNLELTPMIAPCTQLADSLRSAQTMPETAITQFAALSQTYHTILAKLQQLREEDALHTT